MTTKQDYRNFKSNTIYNFCWACGRDESQRPDRWFSEWYLDRAHICNKPRVEDVRLIVQLCRLCHARFSGARIPACEGHDWPRLTVANLLFLKERFQPEQFDRGFLQRHSVQILPDAAPLPNCYVQAYRARRHAV